MDDYRNLTEEDSKKVVRWFKWGGFFLAIVFLDNFRYYTNEGQAQTVTLFYGIYFVWAALHGASLFYHAFKQRSEVK